MGGLAVAVPLVELCGALAFGHATPFNDFKDYYLAAKLIAAGQSPYDLAALAEIARRTGVELTIGTGYSYPLPFAVAMLPFTVLPLPAATLVFTAGSLVAFGAVVALWLRSAVSRDERPPRIAVAALLAGSYPPVFGSLFNGQANLLVVAVFGSGVLVVLRGERGRVSGGMAIGLAAIVKLVPAIVAVPLLLAGRRREVVALIGAAVVALVVASAVAPSATGAGGRLIDLLAPDAFFTNQSINGFVSRLVLPADKTSPVLPGAFDPLIVGIVAAAAFGALNLGLLAGARRRMAEFDTLRNAVAMAVAAAVIAAPKNSFWNHVLLLVPAGLLLVPDGRIAALRGRDQLERLLLVAWFGSALLQQALWAASPALDGWASAVLTLAYSSALYGAFALWLLFARRMVRRSAIAPGGLVSSGGGPE